MVLQVKKWGKTFEIGSLLQILGRITTLHAILNTAEPEHGGFMVKISQCGNSLAQVHSCGYMGCVSVCAVIISPQLTISTFAAGAGKSILWYINIFMFSFRKLIRCHHLVRQSSRISAACANQGSHHASDSELAQRLKDLLAVPGQATAYIVIDALDECPITVESSSPREEVLDFVEELVRLQFPNMRICVTSRPEADIERVLSPLAFRSVSLHGENGQVEDIAEYVKFVVSTDRNMKTWRKEDKDLVIQVLTSKAGGM